jgi:hypothetical protein
MYLRPVWLATSMRVGGRFIRHPNISLCCAAVKHVLPSV